MVFSPALHLLSPGIQLPQIFTESCSRAALWDIWEDKQAKKKKKALKYNIKYWFLKLLHFPSMQPGSSIFSLSPLYLLLILELFLALSRAKKWNLLSDAEQFSSFYSASNLSFSCLFVYAKTSQKVEPSIDIAYHQQGRWTSAGTAPLQDSCPLVFNHAQIKALLGRHCTDSWHPQSTDLKIRDYVGGPNPIRWALWQQQVFWD